MKECEPFGDVGCAAVAAAGVAIRGDAVALVLASQSPRPRQFAATGEESTAGCVQDFVSVLSTEVVEVDGIRQSHQSVLAIRELSIVSHNINFHDFRFFSNVTYDHHIQLESNQITVLV